ncbi:metal ABC transporter substrate-binding protein [Eubacterium oxidoreducens]|uniref:Zinc transport system substrate-binding protein n=1 Tax=Eubacterium oxidoreducens TaxID=1732 RepID=A0A1G6CIQ3_EUBOX|nr:metal ABC transporter substrate-binding protein [Eubacterium oxidoreducens]SDB32808.1 zinc transport system substrate-binding protein [Eubacterium oxidoreducens]
MIRKKIIVIMTACMLVMSVLLGGCSSVQSQTDPDKIQITATLFPQYDWLRQIVGEENEYISLHLINDSGTDLHSYQPTVQDVALMSESDLLVYTGGESEEWVLDMQKEAANEDLQIVSLLDVLGEDAVEEEEVGEEAKMSHSHVEEELEYDEHVWLSVKNAAMYVEYLCELVKELDPAHAAMYEANANAYIKQLSELDAQYENVVSQASNDTLVFADRFPFRYLVEDYGLSYYAAYSGCSADTQVTFETITLLAKYMDESNANAILVLDNADLSLARTVLKYTDYPNREILTMKSLQSATKQQIAEGLNYLDVMEENLAVLKKALG